MNRILLLATTAVFFASCSNNQEAADKARIDSMSQVFTRQHIIDSMNEASVTMGASPAEMTPPAAQSQPSRPVRSHTSSHTTHTNNSGSSGQSSVTTSSSTTTTSQANGPTAAEIEAKRKADRKKQVNGTAAGAMIGAGAGALAGAAAGKNAHFKKEDAIIGGGIGAVVGAGTGLLLSRRKIKRDSAAKK